MSRKKRNKLEEKTINVSALRLNARKTISQIYVHPEHLCGSYGGITLSELHRLERSNIFSYRRVHTRN